MGQLLSAVISSLVPVSLDSVKVNHGNSQKSTAVVPFRRNNVFEQLKIKLESRSNDATKNHGRHGGTLDARHPVHFHQPTEF